MKMSEDLEERLEKLKPSVKRVGPLKLPVILPKGSSKGSTGNPDEERGDEIMQNIRPRNAVVVPKLATMRQQLNDLSGRYLASEEFEVANKLEDAAVLIEEAIRALPEPRA